MNVNLRIPYRLALIETQQKKRWTRNDDKTDARLTQKQIYPIDPTEVSIDMSLCSALAAPQ